MKKLTFALACASAFALFAADIGAPKAGFEDYEAGTAVAGEAEPGSQSTYWLYEGASGSEDGSTVKAYGGDNLAAPTTGGDAGEKYLELSTEGGTLWRSLAEVKTDGGGTLGTAQDVPAGGLYIDTMVQFTPTEDGGTPETVEGDKLAIWLNVDSSGDTPVTNLCVLGTAITTEGSGRNETPKATKTVFKLSGAQVDAGVWYRLTVKALKNIVTLDGDYISGFIVMIDNVPMVIADNGKACDEKFLSYYREGGFFAEGADDLITSGRLIPSLNGYQNEDVSALQAVGFKGSGALDNLAITDEDPLPAPGGFEVDWGKGDVTAVWGDTPPTTEELAAIQSWATANNLSASAVAGDTGAAAYLLGMTEIPTEVPTLAITSIDQTEEGWTVTVTCSAQPDLSKVNGKLTVKTAQALGEEWASQDFDADNLSFTNEGQAVIKVTADGATFMKATLTR